jgi:hypothetical protein
VRAIDLLGQSPLPGCCSQPLRPSVQRLLAPVSKIEATPGRNLEDEDDGEYENEGLPTEYTES